MADVLAASLYELNLGDYNPYCTCYVFSLLFTTIWIIYCWCMLVAGVSSLYGFLFIVHILGFNSLLNFSGLNLHTTRKWLCMYTWQWCIFCINRISFGFKPSISLKRRKPNLTLQSLTDSQCEHNFLSLTSTCSILVLIYTSISVWSPSEIQVESGSLAFRPEMTKHGCFKETRDHISLSSPFLN